MPRKTTNINLIAYSTDASMIEGTASNIIFPKSAEEISRLIKIGSKFTIRGAGTGLVGGAVPDNDIVLDISKMNKILNLDRDKRIVEVESGVILDELNSELGKYNLEFPVNPSSHEVCTIGGMIATNAVGSRAVKYGRTSNWIEEIEAVSGKGEIIKINKASLLDFAGMEGITGIITRAKLKVVEKKSRTASLFAFDELDDIYHSVAKFKLMNSVSALEFLDKITSSIIGLEGRYHLIVEFESDEGELKGKKYHEIMKLRDEVYPSLAKLGFTRIEDPKIFIHKFSELGEFLESGKIPYFGHLGSGIIHPVFQKNDDERIKVLMKYIKSIHGQVSGEHGIGLRKREFVEPMERKLIQRIKKRYDPECKINCNKVIAQGKDEQEEKEKTEKTRGNERVEEAIKKIDEQEKINQEEAKNGN
ncbi:FAD-binding oxidoreductase [Candidatus Pacearchaeota archaeon]|nr:FAD-binding oxidoreductase [Candidatus Pacearchaeota archaeon]